MGRTSDSFVLKIVKSGCLDTEKSVMLFFQVKRKWRNWYTRYFEVVVRVSS